MIVERMSTRSRQISSKLADGVIILDFESGQYYGLNETGTRIWELLDEPQSVSSIVNILCNEYDGDEQLMASDVEGLVGALREKGLIGVYEKSGDSSA